MTEAAFKKIVKEAVAETMREQRTLLRDSVLEALEEVALAAAIREGQSSRPVSRQRVMSALRSRR